jgi:hypothetical protein
MRPLSLFFFLQICFGFKKKKLATLQTHEIFGWVSVQGRLVQPKVQQGKNQTADDGRSSPGGRQGHPLAARLLLIYSTGHRHFFALGPTSTTTS